MGKSNTEQVWGILRLQLPRLSSQTIYTANTDKLKKKYKLLNALEVHMAEASIKSKFSF